MSNIFRKQGINTGSGGGSIDTSSLANKSDLTAIILTGTTNTSGSTISAGTWFYLNGTPCIAKVDIASGATFTEGTNYEEKTVGSALSELNSKTDTIEQNFGTVELTSTAAYPHAVGEYFINAAGQMVKCTAAIAVEDTITIGTNVVLTSVSSNITNTTFYKVNVINYNNDLDNLPVNSCAYIYGSSAHVPANNLSSGCQVLTVGNDPQFRIQYLYNTTDKLYIRQCWLNVWQSWYVINTTIIS